MKTNHLKNCKYIEIKDILGGGGQRRSHPFYFHFLQLWENLIVGKTLCIDLSAQFQKSHSFNEQTTTT